MYTSIQSNFYEFYVNVSFWEEDQMAIESARKKDRNACWMWARDRDGDLKKKHDNHMHAQYKRKEKKISN